MVRCNIPKPTFFEKALAHVAPDFATKTYRTRVAFAMAESYTGASRSRRALSGWSTSIGDADADILPYLDNLRQKSRDLARNNALAGAAINTKVTSIVGTGLTLQASINRDILGIDDATADEWERSAEAEFRLWSKDCDIERISNFDGLQELAFRSVLENGDILITTPYNKLPGQAYGLKLQLIEADRISNADNATDSETLSGGVERDQFGAPNQYHVLTTHPGSRYRTSAKWTQIPAYGKDGRRNAILLYNRLRVGQFRGVPDLASVIEAIKQLGRYTESEVMRAVVSALFTVFVTTEDGGGLSLDDLQTETGARASDQDVKLGAGNIVDLMPGEKVEFANPNSPNTAFDPFVQAVTRQIGARLEIPFEVLTKQFNASFSASKAALIEAWRYFMKQRKWLADSLCRPVYELFLTEAVATGRINAPGFLSGDPLIREAWLGSEWVGDAAGNLDEVKAVQAAADRIATGLSNEAIETTAMTGRDRDTVYRQRKKEIEQRRADKMMPSDLEPAKAGTAGAQPDADTSTEDTETVVSDQQSVE